MSYLAQFHHHLVGDQGSSRKLVFLHGLMGSGANWLSIAKAFSSDYHILYYDQRGHGRSFSPGTGYSPKDFAEDLLHILDELGWQKIYLVGHSMGGRNAAQFAFLYPERVEKLVIEDMGPDENPRSIAKMNDLLDGIPAPFVSKTEAKNYFTGDFLQQFAERPQVKLLGQFLYTNIIEKNGHYDWRFNIKAIKECVHKGRAEDLYREFSQLKMPTLLLRGQHSEDLAPEVYQRVLTENSMIQGIEIADSGHWIHYDQKDRFIEVVRDFFG